MKILISLIYLLSLNPIENSISTSDGGSLKYYNIECYGNNGEKCDIIIEKYSVDKKLIWKTTIGGTSWDYVEDVLEIEDGLTLEDKNTLRILVFVKF